MRDGGRQSECVPLTCPKYSRIEFSRPGAGRGGLHGAEGKGRAMLVGYARTSTLEQRAGFEAQKRELKDVGCDKVFAEQVSSVATREKLTAALEFIREGDVLVVTKLDRLAR